MKRPGVSRAIILAPGKLLLLTALCALAIVLAFPTAAISDGKDDDKKDQKEKEADKGVGTWKKIGSLKVKRYFAGASWIPKHKCVVIWGGSSKWPDQRELRSGQCYWAEKDEWVTMAIKDAPTQRIFAGAATDGSKFIFWGGCKLDTFGRQYSFHSTGGIYDPKKNSWEIMSYGGPHERKDPFVTYGNKHIIVFGGAAPYEKHTTVLNSGGGYDLKKHRWDPKMEIDADGEPECPKGRSDFAAVWTGKKLVVWGGHWPRSWPNPHINEDYSWGDGAMWDYKKKKGGKWTSISTENAPPAHYGMKSVWAEELKLMLMFGGRSFDGTRHTTHGRVYAFDPAKNKWVAKDNESGQPPRIEHGAVWTGKKLIVWGGLAVIPDEAGNTKLDYTNSGGMYDPETDTWEPMSLEDAPSPRANHVMIWMDGRLLIAGGIGLSRSAKEARALGDCYIYAPPPTPISIKTDKGKTDGGTGVTITGYGFTEDVTVSFGKSVADEIDIKDGMTIKCKTPPHDEGAVDVTVTNRRNESGVLQGAFTYVKK